MKEKFEANLTCNHKKHFKNRKDHNNMDDKFCQKHSSDFDNVRSCREQKMK